MLTRSVVLAATLTVGLVAAVGSSAIAVAVIPGDATGATQQVEAIASATQDPAEGSNAWFIESTPVTLTIAKPVVIDDGGDKPAAKVDPAAGHAPTSTQTPTPPPAASDTGTENANGGVGVGDSTTPSNSGSSADDKKDKSKQDKDKDKKDKSKKDKDESDVDQ
jgi:hypothetical protein